MKDYTQHLTNHEDKETSQIPIFKLFSELEKIRKGRLRFSKIPIFHLF